LRPRAFAKVLVSTPRKDPFYMATSLALFEDTLTSPIFCS
jgi:hypothetical protein